MTDVIFLTHVNSACKMTSLSCMAPYGMEQIVPEEKSVEFLNKLDGLKVSNISLDQQQQQTVKCTAPDGEIFFCQTFLNDQASFQSTCVKSNMFLKHYLKCLTKILQQDFLETRIFYKVRKRFVKDKFHISGGKFALERCKL